jgi:hypothetical protein
MTCNPRPEHPAIGSEDSTKKQNKDLLGGFCNTLAILSFPPTCSLPKHLQAELDKDPIIFITTLPSWLPKSRH